MNMLNISVLVKFTLDPLAIQWNYYDGKPDYLASTVNKPDLHVLQWACDYKKEHGARLTVVSVVPQEMEVPIERVKKFPVDEMILIRTKGETARKDAIASLLANELKKQMFDLILCGAESEDERAGVTPIIIAELLHLPCITRIHGMEPGTDGNWTVHRKEGRGRIQSFQVRLPALIGAASSIAQLSYIPRQPSDGRLVPVTVLDVEIPDQQAPAFQRHKWSEPQPVIHYLEVPDEPLAQHRILQISGLRGSGKEGNSGKKRSEISSEFAQFTARQLERWLQEGK